MVEWHVAPDYIVNNWTDEQLDLMIEKLVKRKKGEASYLQSKESGVTRHEPGTREVSDRELFRLMGKNVRVVKHGN